MTARLALTGRGRNTKPPLKKESPIVDMQVKFPVSATLSPQPISIDVLAEKYLADGESTIEDLYRRVARALAAVEKPEDRLHWEDVFYRNMLAGGIGAGRIMAAAGLDTKATLINCFVQFVADATNGFDEQGRPGIYTALAQAAETMRRGGGVGYDFSELRPRGSKVKGTNSLASGPCSFIDVFDASCTTVESAGARRGAQMGVMRIDHPDVLDFITAKRQKGRWNNFNVSVGVTDAFMHAVENDKPWALTHKATPSEAQIAAGAHQQDDGTWVYRTVQARELWGSIMKSTYDFAEPGILFLDNINNDNNLQYCESISATNPCVAAGTLVSTPDGYKAVERIKVGDAIATVDGLGSVETVEIHDDVEVFDVEMSDGSLIRATAAHIFHVAQGKHYSTETRLDQLQIGDRIRLAPAVMPSVKNVSPHQNWTERQFGLVVGAVIGDGCFTEKSKQLKIAVHNKSQEWAKQLCDVIALVGHAGINKSTNEVDCVTSTAALPLLDAAGLARGTSDTKELPLHLLNSNEQFLAGFIDGMISTDGNVHMSKSNPMIRVSSVNKNSLMMLKRAMSFFGVLARVYKTGKAGESHVIGDRKIERQHDIHVLVVLGDGIRKLYGRVHITRPERRARLQELVRRYSLTGCTWAAQIKSITPAGKARVYDLYEPNTDTWITDGVVNRGCGEQPLPPYGCCDLGPVILTKFVRDPFTADALFDAESFRDCVAVQVRMLDNVLDATVWPLPEQHAESQAKRRIGVGFTGLGDALIMLGLKYNSEDGRSMAQFIAANMREAAYKASVDLAKERGAFPLFEADAYLASGFASRLPSWLQDDIRAHGIRNSHLLSIAPTGTVSLAFADNASNGIEPAFSWTYDRKKRTAGGGSAHYAVEDHAYRLYRAMFGADAALPDTFVSALEMSAEDHIAMMEAVQPFIDTAISKTVNVPADYPFEDFQKLYMQSWRAGLKGCATYRPNDTLGAVLSVTPAATPVAAQPVNAVIGRRPEGPLNAIVDKIEYFAHDGARRIYLVVSFMMVDGVERPMEFFMPVGQTGESQQWITATMRSLSLAARGGFLDKALDDLRKVAWDRGSIRYGFKAKDDGTRVPLWHDSEVALLAYAIQSTIANRGAAQADAPAPVPAVAAAIAASPAVSGSKCPECGARAVIKKDGCSFCTECGHLGSCG